MGENFKRRGGALKMQPQNKLLLRVARDVKRDMPTLTVKQAIGLATNMIGIVQTHMEAIHDEMFGNG